jgi:very-short-patch-repair endonuclease
METLGDLEAQLIVEIDGSQHQDRADYDAARTEVLEACGCRIVRFDNYNALTNPVGVGDTILRELEMARA